MVHKNYAYGDVQILALSGRVDGSNLPATREWIESATSTRPAYVVINLDQVDFLDSNGLATLVWGLKRSRQIKGDLYLCCLRQPVRILFELTRLDRVFEIYPCEEDAVGAFQTIEVTSQS